MRSAGFAAFVAAPLLLLTSMWFAVWRYYHVAEPVPGAHLDEAREHVAPVRPVR